jgi:uncharacterized protein YxjI
MATQMTAEEDVIAGIDLTGDEYTVKQHLIRNKYNVYDGDGEHILKAKQKLFKLKEQFPFTDPDGEPVFEINAKEVFDVAGDYVITESEGDEPVAVLDKNWTLLTHEWKVRDPDDERLLAKIESQGVGVQLLRSLPLVSIAGQFIPHEYTIEDTDGNRLGDIEGRFSSRDIYDITIEDTGDVPKEALVAAAIAIDALEGN